MLCGKLRDIDVWRSTPASGVNWGDPTWGYVFTFRAVVQPFEASDGLRNNERFANVRMLVTAPVSTDVYDTDEFVIDNVHHRVAYVEKFDNDIEPHLEIFLGKAQYERS